MPRFRLLAAAAAATVLPAGTVLAHPGQHGEPGPALAHILASSYHMLPVMAAAGLSVAALAIARRRARLAAWLGGGSALAALVAVGVFAAAPV